MGRSFCIITLAAVLLSLPLSFAEARDRERTIRCESTGEKYSYCRTDTTGTVELGRQLSKTRCEEYDTWGADGDGSGIHLGSQRVPRGVRRAGASRLGPPARRS